MMKCTEISTLSLSLTVTLSECVKTRILINLTISTMYCMSNIVIKPRNFIMTSSRGRLPPEFCMMENSQETILLFKIVLVFH